MSELTPLDYDIPKSPDRKSSPWLRWIAFIFVILQAIWVVPSIFMVIGTLADGLPKRPFDDLCCYVIMMAPSVAAIALGVWHCCVEYRNRKSVRRCKLSIFSILIAALYAGFNLYSWIIDDIINRNIPHAPL